MKNQKKMVLAQPYFWQSVTKPGKRTFDTDEEAIATLRQEIVGLTMIYVIEESMRTVWHYTDLKAEKENEVTYDQNA